MRHARLLPFGTFFIASLACAGANPPGQVKDPTISLPELHGPGRILRDVDGMPHIYAFDEHDALFLQGWVQAQDRLFQLDVLRRQASGTLAELLGSVRSRATSSCARSGSRAARRGRSRRTRPPPLRDCRHTPMA